MKKALPILFTLLVTVLSSASKAQISGIAYKDFNASGIRDNTVGTFVEPYSGWYYCKGI
ncbi:MAG: hypothetical protein IPP48_07430 [Chitinophagaceae bacterium]|nr:hypothetical protein [Chitinophagaceae bacterium]